MMVEVLVDQFEDIHSDVEFTEKLVQEESVLCLPGQVENTDRLFLSLIPFPSLSV